MSLFLPFLVMWHYMFTKKGFLVHQYIGVFFVFLMMVIYPFIIPYSRYSTDPTIWGFFRQLFAVILLSWPIAYVDILLKQRKGSVYDVLFGLGSMGTLFCSIQMLGYLFYNLIQGDDPAVIEYFGATFYDGAIFFETLALLVGTGLLILLIFSGMKYSNSVRIYCYCKLITTLGFIIKTALDGYYYNDSGSRI